MQSYSDRSRTLTGQRCPRQRWFEYHQPNGTKTPGIVPTRLNMDLLLGLTFHQGVEGILNQVLTGNSFTIIELDEIVKGVLEGTEGWPGMWPLLKSKGLVLGDKEDAYYVYSEQAALAEALIRAYATVVLPKLLERFEVVEVERDDHAAFTSDDETFTLNWGYRADALLMERDSLDLYILSLKTTKEFDRRKANDAERDMQGLSEVAAVDQRLQKWHQTLVKGRETWGSGYESYHDEIPDWFVHRFDEGASPSVLGVKMEYALKGRRSEYPKGSGQSFYTSPLIRPWYTDGTYTPKRKGASSVPEGYACMWEFQDDLGGNHTLGSGWRPRNIWEAPGGVKGWIETLATTSIQGKEPGYFLEQAFVLPPENFRNEDDIKRWERRMVFAEERLMEGEMKVKSWYTAEMSPDNTDLSEYEDNLDRYFPPHSNSCSYPGPCAYLSVCYGPKAYLFDPLASGLYEPRHSNHEAELVTIKGV